MEQPRRPYQFGMPETVDGDAGAIQKHPKVPHVAGKVLLHEMPSGSETQNDQRVDHTERSVWHRIGLNKVGQVVEQPYGQEFYKERSTENNGMPPADDPMQPMQPAQQRQPTQQPQPQAAPVAPVPQAQQTQFTASNPIYSAMAHPLAAQQPQPKTDSTQQPAQTPQHQTPTPQLPLTGAVNPSYTSLLPQLPQEQMLPEGTPAPVDAQHLLPATKSHVSRIFKSPWLWLALGLGMVIYFGRSLF